MILQRRSGPAIAQLVTRTDAAEPKISNFTDVEVPADAEKAGLEQPLKIKISTGWPRMCSQGVCASIRWRPNRQNLMEAKILVKMKPTDLCWPPEARCHKLLTRR